MGCPMPYRIYSRGVRYDTVPYRYSTVSFASTQQPTKMARRPPTRLAPVALALLTGLALARAQLIVTNATLGFDVVALAATAFDGTVPLLPVDAASGLPVARWAQPLDGAWADPANWAYGRAPCVDDVAVLRASATPLAVAVTVAVTEVRRPFHRGGSARRPLLIILLLAASRWARRACSLGATRGWRWPRPAPVSPLPRPVRRSRRAPCAPSRARLT